MFKSQNGQDKYIYETYFKNKMNGVFVELGAIDGIDKSNSYFFEKQLNWNGLCIEPIKYYYDKLVSNRRCVCSNDLISGDGKPHEFTEIIGYGKGLSGIVDNYNPEHLKRIEREGIKNKSILTKESIKLGDILKENNMMNIDILFLDTEGSELNILRSLDWCTISINVICVEANYKNDEVEILKLLESKCYIFDVKIGSDLIFYKSKSYIHDR